MAMQYDFIFYKILDLITIQQLAQNLRQQISH